MSDEDVPDSPFEPVDQPADQQADPTGLEAGGGRSDAALDRLLDGNRDGPSVAEVEADYGIRKPWSIGLRGIVRAATGSGVPPLAEIFIGSGLGLVQLRRGGGLQLDRGDDQDDQDGAEDLEVA